MMLTLVALGVAHHHHPAQCVHAQRQKALFTDRRGVFHRGGPVITQGSLCMGEADPVLFEVAVRFDRIELELHGLIICMECI